MVLSDPLVLTILEESFTGTAASGLEASNVAEERG